MQKIFPIIALVLLFFSCGRNTDEDKQKVENLFAEAIGLYNQNQFENAETLLIKALEIEKNIKPHNYLGHIYLYLGLLNFQQARYYKSLEFYKSALTEYESTADQKNQSVVMTNIGGIYAYLNQYENAIDSYNKAYSLSRFTLDRESQAIALSNIALAYDALENYDKALEYFNKAIIMNKVSDDNIAVTSNLNNIGEMFIHQERYTEAMKSLEEALSLAIKTRNVDLEGVILKNIANIQKNKNKNEDALNIYFNSLLNARLTPNPDLEREVLNNIGEIYFKTFQYDRARAAFEEALAIARSKEDRFSEGFFLNCIGNTLKNLAFAGDETSLELSEKNYNSALEIFKSINYSQGISSVYFSLGNIFEHKRNYKKAIEYYKHSIWIRENLIEPPMNSFLFQILNTDELNYSRLADLLIKTDKKEEALLFLERQRIWEMLEIVKSSKLKFKDKNLETRLRSYKNLNNELSSIYYSYIFENSRDLKGTDQDRIDVLKNQIVEKKKEFQNVRSEFQNASGLIKYLGGIPDFSIKDLQNNLDENSMAIDYFMTDTLLYIFSITNQSIDVQKLELSYDAINSQKKHFLRLLYNSEPPVFGTNKSENINPFNNLKDALYNNFLKPIESKLENVKNLYFVYSQNETIFPFHFLIDSTFPSSNRFNRINIFYIPSLSYLGNKFPNNNSNNINILGDRFKTSILVRNIGNSQIYLNLFTESNKMIDFIPSSEDNIFYIAGVLNKTEKKFKNSFIKISPYDSLSYEYLLCMPKGQYYILAFNTISETDISIISKILLYDGAKNVIICQDDKESIDLISNFILDRSENSLLNLLNRLKISEQKIRKKILLLGK